MAVTMDTQLRAMTTIQNMVPVQRDTENPQVRAGAGQRVPNMQGSGILNGDQQGSARDQDRVTLSDNGLQTMLPARTVGALEEVTATTPSQPPQDSATPGTGQTPAAAPSVTQGAAQGGVARAQTAYLAAGQATVATAQSPAANGATPTGNGQGEAANPYQIQQSMNNLTARPDASLQSALSLYA